MRRLERGASYVPLIIVIVLLVVAVVWAWVKTDESDQLRKDLMKARAAADSEQARRIAVADYLRKLSNEIGWPIENETEEKKADYGADYERIDGWIQTQLRGPTSLTERFTGKFDRNAYNVTEDGGIQIDEQDPEKIGYIDPDEVPGEANLEYLFGLVLTGMDRMLNDIGRMVQKIKAEQNLRAADVAAKQTVIEAKDGELGTARDELAQEKSRAANNERALRDENNSLQDRVRQAEDALENAERAAREEKAKLTQELMAANQKVRTLMDRKKPDIVRPGPDGEILSAGEGSGIVVLDRGKADRMMPGLTFLVYNYGKGGVKVSKGRVQVLDVGGDTCTARVLEVLNPMNPLVQGDLFESPIYNPDEVINFYLLGSFRKYGHSDAAARLKALGAAVDTKISIDTDFLVMGAAASEEENLRASEAYKQAMELGIPVITERQLGMFLLY